MRKAWDRLPVPKNDEFHQHLLDLGFVWDVEGGVHKKVVIPNNYLVLDTNDTSDLNKVLYRIIDPENKVVGNICGTFKKTCYTTHVMFVEKDDEFVASGLVNSKIPLTDSYLYDILVVDYKKRCECFKGCKEFQGVLDKLYDMCCDKAEILNKNPPQREVL